MANVNIEAYNKLGAAFAFAQQIKGSADARGAGVRSLARNLPPPGV